MKFKAAVIGYPRSRTYWFSRLLTDGDYHCFHDYWAYHYPVPMDKIYLNASCFPMSTGEEQKYVIIERDKEESKEAFKRFAQIPVPDIDLVYDALEESLAAKQGLRIRYNEIDSRIEEILDYMEVKLHPDRIKVYKDINLQSRDNGVDASEFPYRI